MKVAIAMTILAMSLVAQTVARWTGGQEWVTTVTGKQAVKCEYEYQGRKFWKTFVGYSCPPTVNVQ